MEQKTMDAVFFDSIPVTSEVRRKDSEQPGRYGPPDVAGSERRRVTGISDLVARLRSCRQHDATELQTQENSSATERGDL